MTEPEHLLFALNRAERTLLVSFAESKQNGAVLTTGLMRKLAGLPSNNAVSRAFARFRDLGILQTDMQRSAYWPCHHSPTDLGIGLIALIVEVYNET